MTDAAPPLSTAVKLNFGIGQIAEGIKSCAFGTFLLFYYNQVLGLDGGLAGLAIALALVFDAVTDPVAGSVSDRWQSRQGRRHPFMYASALPLGISFWLLFSPWVSTDNVGQYGVFAWMLGATVLTRLSMTLYHVPHMALGAELSEDYDERTVLVAIRHFFGAAGYIMVYVLGFGVFFAASEAYPKGQLNPDAYPPFAILLGAAMTVTILISAFGTRSRIPYLPDPHDVDKRVRVSDVFTEAIEAMRNTSFRWMMIGFILVIVAFGVAGATGLYMFTFFWALDPTQTLFVLVAIPFGTMLGYVFAARFFGWLDKRNAMIVGGFAWALIHAIPVGFYFMGLTPALGTWGLAMFLFVPTFMGCVALGQVIVGVGTAMADIADENELQTGRRQEGVFFGAAAFANKCSAALGSYVAGLVLAWINWPTGAGVQSASDIPAETLVALAVIAGPITSLLVIPGLLCLRGYTLNRARMADIQAALRGDSATA